MIRSPRLHRIAVVLALAGVLLRGAIPAGFMPTFGEGAYRGAWLMLCDGGAHEQMDMPMPGMDHSHDGPQSALHAAGECPYAAAAVSSPLPAPSGFTLAFLGGDFIASPLPATPASSGIHHLRPPSRGPPLVS